VAKLNAAVRRWRKSHSRDLQLNLSKLSAEGEWPSRRGSFRRETSATNSLVIGETPIAEINA
jgi:hypothetical protein